MVAPFEELIGTLVAQSDGEVGVRGENRVAKGCQDLKSHDFKPIRSRGRRVFASPGPPGA